MKKMVFILLFLFTQLLWGQWTESNPGGGSPGTEGNAWVIDSAADLELLATNVNAGTNYSGVYFVQTLDIDLSGYANWTPIGNFTATRPFSGRYGVLSGKKITGLTINNSSVNNLGLFGYTVNANIQDVVLVSVNVIGGSYVGALIGSSNGTYIEGCFSSGTVTGVGNVGGLVGYNNNSGNIVNSSSSATVQGSGQNTGGLVGQNYGSTIQNCNASGSVSGTSYVGGLVGMSRINSTINRCFATGNVSGSGTNIGGLAGANQHGIDDATATISESYATGSVSGTGTMGGLVGANSPVGTVNNSYSRGSVTRSSGVLTDIGGFIGSNFGTISNSYSTGKVYELAGIVWDEGAEGKDKGFQGNSGGTTSNNFFDTNTSGQTTGYGATAKTTGEMTTIATFTDVGWNSDTWKIVATINNSYPHSPIFFSGGIGTAGDPYQIATKSNLISLSLYSSYWGSAFVQTKDIYFFSDETTEDWDLNGTADGSSPSGFSPIGNNGTKFTGTYNGSYNGQYYKIDNLYISRSTTDYVALFGFVQGTNAKVENLGVTNAVITGQNSVSGLAGRFSDGTLSKCYVTGTIIGNQSVGGLFGLSDGSATITQSYSSGSVSGVSYTGGLFGGNSSSIANCYSLASVTRISGANTDFGAFGGNSNGTIDKCYSTGSVTYSGDTNPTTKGFLGSNSNPGGTTNNFFDSESSLQSSGTGATAKTTALMKTSSTFTDSGWDFTSTWQIIGTNYPDLRSNSNSALPVELTSFSADYGEKGIKLNWQTATEVNNYGFEIERAISNYKLGIENFEKIGFVSGNGNSNSPKSYSYLDPNPPSGKVQYRLKQIDFDGKYEYSDVVEVNVEAPIQFSLQQNYPNPFNPETAISYKVQAASQVNLKVFDVLGREVATLVNEFQQPGLYVKTLRATSLPSGVYFYRLQAGSFTSTKKMILLR